MYGKYAGYQKVFSPDFEIHVYAVKQQQTISQTQTFQESRQIFDSPCQGEVFESLSASEKLSVCLQTDKASMLHVAPCCRKSASTHQNCQ